MFMATCIYMMCSQDIQTAKSYASMALEMYVERWCSTISSVKMMK